MPRTRTLTIQRIGLERVQMQLHHPLPRAGKSLERREGIRVSLLDTSGTLGRGEALPLPSAGTEPMHEVADAVLRAQEALTGHTGPLEQLLETLDRSLDARPATRCAFDVAAHDLEARVRGIPVARRLAPDAASRVEVNALLGASDPGTCAHEARRAVTRGYRTLKLKLGAAEPGLDMKRVEAVREAVGPDVRLRIDANGAWTAREALHVLEKVAGLGIELAEQPTAPHALDELAWVHARSPIPIAADESLATPEGCARLLQSELAGIAILKPMVLGGLAPAAELARRATARGIRVVVTTTLDGPVGTAAALHLAAAYGSPTLAHGLAACDALDVHFPESLVPRGGSLPVADAPGLGDLE